MSAKTQVDESEASLSELSRSISTPNVLKKYIATCNSFIQQVAAANLYNDIPDSRGVYIATLLPKLHQRLELLQKLNNIKGLSYDKVHCIGSFILQKQNTIRSLLIVVVVVIFYIRT